jgi:hypothetical protein
MGLSSLEPGEKQASISGSGPQLAPRRRERVFLLIEFRGRFSHNGAALKTEERRAVA